MSEDSPPSTTDATSMTHDVDKEKSTEESSPTNIAQLAVLDGGREAWMTVAGT